MDYEFTNDWFKRTAGFYWGSLLESEKPRTVLEIGSFEGASACFLIEHAKHPMLEIHCIDSWEGGIEHKTNNVNMTQTEERFYRNTKLAKEKSAAEINLVIHKGLSSVKLPELLGNGKKSFFDFIYIDGSHQAADVLFDAVLSFQLVKVGGLLVFDDYLWKPRGPGGWDPLMSPKIAIDAFANIYSRKVQVLNVPMTQQCIRKLSD